MAKSVLYFGHTTNPDIHALRNAFPSPETLGTILYADVERVIKSQKGSGRFASVTNRWRKLHESETGQVIGAVRGEGFKVLPAPEVVDLAGSKLRSACRSTKRGCSLAYKADPQQLNPEDVKRRDHVLTTTTKLLGIHGVMPRQLGGEVMKALSEPSKK